jgi:osmoprotectant transport system substrate-binding protein
MAMPRVGLALALAAIVTAAACGGPGTQGETRKESRPSNVVVAATEGLESQAVSQMYKQVLEEADYSVEWTFEYTSQGELFEALEAGDIDVAPFYLSSLTGEIDASVVPSGDPVRLAGAPAEALEEEGLQVLAPAAANSGPALVVPPVTAEKLEVATVSELAAVSDRLTLAAPPECESDPACLPALTDAYGIDFGGFEGTADPARALDRGDADVAILPATSAAVRRERLVVLVDDRQVQPADNLTPIAREAVVTDEIAGLLNAVSGSLDAGELTVYNGVMDLGEAPGVVATLHLKNERLLGVEQVAGTAEPPLGQEPPEGCIDATGETVVRVVADELAFDTRCLVVSSDQAIELVNEDDAYPHTFTVSRDRTYAPPFLLDLDDGQGGQTVTSDPVGQKLETGGWPFVCRYHEFMAGEIWVR